MRRLGRLHGHVFDEWFVFVPNPITSNKYDDEKKETPDICLFHDPLPKEDGASIADEGVAK